MKKIKTVAVHTYHLFLAAGKGFSRISLRRIAFFLIFPSENTVMQPDLSLANCGMRYENPPFSEGKPHIAERQIQ